jgi:hypothetical protein
VLDGGSLGRDELPALLEKYRDLFLQAEVTSVEELEEKVMRRLTQLGFASEDNGIYRFLAPMHRFLDVCLSVQQDRDLAATLHSSLPLPTPVLQDEEAEDEIISLAENDADESEEDALARAMSDRYRVICPDVVGRGHSDWLRHPAGYQVPAYVSDMVALIVLVVALLLVIRALWKELLFATFDPLGAGAAGLPVRRLDDLLLILIAVTIVISLQAVGIVLVVAMITTPAATAQLLVKRFGQMIGVAALIGVTAAVAGLYLSYALDLASGAAIVLFETALFLVVLLITSLRGRRTA